MEITHWIQSADFKFKELGVADQADVIGLLHDHRWLQELETLRQLEERGEELCPPGLGLVAGEGRVLHFCPTPEGLWDIHHQNRKTHKVLGFFRTTRSTSESFSAATSARAEQFVIQFFQTGRVDLSLIE